MIRNIVEPQQIQKYLTKNVIFSQHVQKHLELSKLEILHLLLPFLFTLLHHDPVSLVDNHLGEPECRLHSRVTVKMLIRSIINQSEISDRNFQPIRNLVTVAIPDSSCSRVRVLPSFTLIKSQSSLNQRNRIIQKKN